MNAIRAGWIRKALLAVLSAQPWQPPTGTKTAGSSAPENTPRAQIARAVRNAVKARAREQREQAGESTESEDDISHVQPAIPRVQVLWIVLAKHKTRIACAVSQLHVCNGHNFVETSRADHTNLWGLLF